MGQRGQLSGDVRAAAAPRRRIVVLTCPRWLLLWRVLRRSLFERGRRPDLPAGCPEHVDWALLKFIWRFERVTWPRIEAARLAHGPDIPVTRLRREREIEAFMASLPPPR